jgi:hypothetical protein
MWRITKLQLSLRTWRSLALLDLNLLHGGHNCGEDQLGVVQFELHVHSMTCFVGSKTIIYLHV